MILPTKKENKNISVMRNTFFHKIDVLNSAHCWKFYSFELGC